MLEIKSLLNSISFMKNGEKQINKTHEMVILHSPNRFSIKKIVQIFSHSQKVMAKKLMSFTPIKVFNSNTKDSMWDHNKRPCYFFELFGHLIKYSSDKMIESGQGTLN